MTTAIDQATAFWTAAPGQGCLRRESLPPAGADGVIIQTLFSGISRGSESLVFSGRVPESEYDRMRAPFQAGDFPAPVKYGYASVGRIVAGAADRIGQTVFCLHPHQDRYRVPVDAVHGLPPGLPPERAVLGANMETALNACWDARISVGDRVTVIGAGVVGALVAWLADAIPGTELTLVDINPARAALAEQLGLSFARPEQAPTNQDVVVHASASPAGLAQALEIAGIEARVIEMSWFGTTRPAVPLGEAFHSRRLTLRSSQVGRLPVDRQPRWDHRRRLAKALELLCNARLDALISGETNFRDLPETMPKLLGESGDALCHRIRY